MKIKYTALFAIAVMILCVTNLDAQRNKKKNSTVTTSNKLDDLSIPAMSFRCVGPALTSGRISDFVLNPEKPHEYYVAVSSGGVWKTLNNGTTYEPIFDNEGSYSIGCVSMDPNNSNTIWVGTGENNNQRSVAYGDGVYKSIDGGASWKNMGLKTSEHIGKIIIHPENSDVIWVAAIGPLWNSGGERGVYKSTDGGENWKNVLNIDKHTGVSDLIIDPRNPDVLYAAAHQRARHVFTYLGGGPGSGIYKSVDGGETWEKANKGLPGIDLGRIGLAISEADPEILYAIVEAAQGKSGFYKSTNRAASWQKQSSYVTSGNYYQEIVTDPVDPNTIYSMNTWLNVSHNGGKSFAPVGEVTKHVDNHCMWINPENNKHWLVGCDGGIYETWDAAKTWDFKANLPVTQFYKVSVDNDRPFYNIYGGTQDNSSIGGPSRTITDHGIGNYDWYITHGGDGFETQVDPSNPDIVYSQSQYGVLVRYDRKSGEEIGIQPKERKGENAYRWNWDAPLVASPNHSGRIYFAANKVFRSDDYGNSWEVISDDLTKQIQRNDLKIMDRVWSFEAVAKNRSTSQYGTIVAFSESLVNENLLVAGTDDGLIQITENGGETWRKVENISGVPPNTYVNAVYCSQHDENVIYAAFNHHKYGDFKPYIYKSTNKGVSWQKISNNLPERGSVYSIEEDHVNKDLIFCGTEFGVFFSPNGGGRWKQLKGDVPIIAVRDLAIQKREHDLVLGTFGRGFYVLDDYSALRNISTTGTMEKEGITEVRETWMYEKSTPLGLPGKAMVGDSYYSGTDLGPVAIIDYYIKDKFTTAKDDRRKQEKKDAKEGRGNKYPTYEALAKERNEKSAQLLFTIKDASGKVVRKILKPHAQGLQRLKWDMRFASKEPINLQSPSFYNPWAGKREGSLVGPGSYTISLALIKDDEISEIGEAVSFTLKNLEDRVMPAKDDNARIAFQREVAELSRSMEGAGHLMNEVNTKMRHMKEAIKEVEEPMENFYAQYVKIENELKNIRKSLYGDPLNSLLDLDAIPSPTQRMGWIGYEQKYSSSTPTETHRMSFAIAKEEFEPILKALQKLASEDVERLEKMLEEADAPYTPGRALKMMQNN